MIAIYCYSNVIAIVIFLLKMNILMKN